MKIQAPTGMRDILGEDIKDFRYLEEKWQQAVEEESFSEIITPILEEKSLFVRSAGEFSDIVSKEMFECGELVLRPEGTAPVVRAILEKNLKIPQKFYYFAPFFRKEKPQKGRFRQFYQYGFEVLGENAPQAEIDSLRLINNFYNSLNIKFRFDVNYIPNEESLKSFEDSLMLFYSENLENLSDSSKEKFKKGSFLRILDSKEDVEINKRAPVIIDFLNEKEKQEWEKIISFLEKLNIPVVKNPYLVRGLDYYQGFVFEVVDESSTLGSQNALGGGGRYNKLSKQLGSQEVISAFGFGGGVERLLYQVKREDIANKVKVYFACTEEDELLNLFSVKEKLKTQDMIVDVSLDFSSGFKKMFKRADKNNADFVVVLGSAEVEGSFCKIKNLKSGEEKIVNKSYQELTKEDFLCKNT